MMTCPAREQLKHFLADSAASVATESLAAHINTCPACQAVLEELTDGRSHTLFTPGPLSVSPAADAGPPRLEGYELLDKLGSGGMGEVWRGRDPRLRRELAIKVPHPKHQRDAARRRRFLEEARIAGQLQHPGIVPVYELGEAPDRPPYFTMKLVRGRTLAELLGERTDPASDRPRFLAVFQQVAQTLAYAHARGVIHRDFKPANVMVGAFGEVQVMDWGLAKVLPEPAADEPASAGTPPGAAAPTGAADCRAADAGSHAGAVLGTPAYMAPEQARGEVERVDRRSDVFGLGALLCEILTGAPPYRGESTREIHARAADGELADAWARLDGCGADADLLALARACLAPEPARRPRDAQAVADAVTAYLNGVQERLRQAEWRRAAAEIQAREERKRRRVQLALAAAVLLLVAGGGGGAWLWQQQRQELAQKRQTTGGAVALGEARLLRDQARAAPLGDGAKFREALAAAEKAAELARTGEASAAVRQQAEALVGELRDEEAAAAADRRLLAALPEVRGPREGPHFRADERGFMEELSEPSDDAQFAAAFRAWGLDVDGTLTAEAVERLAKRPPAVVTEVVAALTAAGCGSWRSRPTPPRSRCWAC